MPRRGQGSKIPKDAPGAPNRPAVPVVDAPAEQHGQRQQLVEAQRDAPPGRPPTETPPGNPLEAAIGAATQGLGPSVGLAAPSDGRPITSGLPIGPGPGPEALFSQRRSKTAEQLERLAFELDDPDLMEMATLARQRGL